MRIQKLLNARKFGFHQAHNARRLFRRRTARLHGGDRAHHRPLDALDLLSRASKRQHLALDAMSRTLEELGRTDIELEVT